MSDNKEVDAKIVAVLKSGPMRFRDIVGACRLGCGERVYDRRLQSLRRRGILKFLTGTGWQLAVNPDIERVAVLACEQEYGRGTP